MDLFTRLALEAEFPYIVCIENKYIQAQSQSIGVLIQAQFVLATCNVFKSNVDSTVYEEEDRFNEYRVLASDVYLITKIELGADNPVEPQKFCLDNPMLCDMNNITNGQLVCAERTTQVFENNGKNLSHFPCPGTEGSPLICRRSNNKTDVYGILNYLPDSSCEKKRPLVFTRIDDVTDFVHYIIGKALNQEGRFFQVTNVTPSPYVNPLAEIFSVSRDNKSDRHVEDNRFIVEFMPTIPFQRFFSYQRVEFLDGTEQVLYIKGVTIGPHIKLSHSRVVFKTTTAASTSQFHMVMENDSDCYDIFSWDFISEGSEIQISPMSGLLKAKCQMDVYISFEARKRGLFYRTIPCLFKYQEPQYLEVIGFHSKTKMALDLEKYLTLYESLPTYPTNFCRYVSDCAPYVSRESKPTVSSSRRFINFGSVLVEEGCERLSVQEIFLTNHADKDLTVEFEYTEPRVFDVQLEKARIPQNDGSVRIVIQFRPNLPELFYSGEIHMAFLWGLKLEYKIPFTITIHLIGDSFSSTGCGWGPSYSIETTRIVLPGTVPGLPSYASFQICKSGPLPLLFSFEPVDRTKTPVFVVKPTQGLIKRDFQLVFVQMFPPGKVDVIYREEWYLIINKFATVKLEICGSCELPFLLVGDDKNVNFPPTTLGSIFFLQVPVKNPTRLELECQCQESLKPQTFSACRDLVSFGPGEQQFIEFEFMPEELGEIHAPIGIRIAWSPYHSAARKCLRGATVQTETVVFLAGTAEVETVYASPKELSMPNVLLNEWGFGSFFLHNPGNSTAFIRLICISKFRFSNIGPWKLTPNEITLEPNQPIEVKVYVLGIERGYNVFTIQYKLYESAMFTKKTSEPKDLVAGDIFVCFPSLKILDIRYEGLAKSLSKRFLWDLLRINHLNEILGNLETSSEHYSNMKLPEYQESSPTFVVEILIRNNCTIPVYLSVDMKKNCPCLPKKADSISRRKMDSSCRHEDQMAASIRDKILQPRRTTILRITVEYEVTDNCTFSMALSVSASHNRWKTSVRVEVERGIIAVDKSSLSFLLHKEFGCKIYPVRFHDVSLEDSSRYYQVIWLYNHSQMDCRYWAEWLFVNNRVFRLINDRAVVPAYSSRPLLILFTPCELRTYEARLALINELGDESHIQIEARATVNRHFNNTERMRNLMPACSQFEEPGSDITFSTDHICVRPMPTHSFDTYIFFMKNTTSNDVIHFTWHRLVVWSTLKVVVTPRSGEIYPGEIFPVRVHIHTYRFAAMFNFAVECLYYRKYESEAYFERSRQVTKLSTVFDTCFVLEPDKKIELAYRNPKIGTKAGKRAKNRIITIGGSVRIFNRELMNTLVPDVANQLRFIPAQKLSLIRATDFSGVHRAQFYEAAETIKRIIWNVMEEKTFREALRKKRSPIRYIDLPPKGKRTLKIPGRQTAMLLSNLLYAATMRLFGLETTLYHDSCKSVVGKKDSSDRYFPIHNDYYENMLSTEIDQVTNTLPSVRIRRYQSRDNLAYVQQDTL